METAWKLSECGRAGGRTKDRRARMRLSPIHWRPSSTAAWSLMVLAILTTMLQPGVFVIAISASGEPCDVDAVSTEVSETVNALHAHGIGSYETFHLEPEELLDRHYRHHRSRRGLRTATSRSDGAEEPLSVAVSAHGKAFRMTLKAAGTSLFHPNFMVHVIENETETAHTNFDQSVFYHGRLEDDHMAQVSAYLDDGILVGTIHVPGDDEYYIERADKYFTDPSFSNIVYKGSDMVDVSGHGSEYCGESYGKLMERQRQFEAERAEQEIDRRTRRQAVGYDTRRNTCGVALVADQKYMQMYRNPDGSFRKNEAIRAMVSLLDGASLIFRSTALDPWGNGSTATGLAQFAAHKVFVYTDNSAANPYSAHASCGSSDSCGSTAECAQPFLDIVSSASPPNSTAHGWDDFCLVHTFTHRDFCGGILGLAWVARPGSAAAGICSRYAGGRSLNTGISTAINFGATVSRQVSTITLAHEFGHNFGASHDTTGLSADGESCAPGGLSGNYIMYLKATDGDDVNNDKFSKCSRNAMSEVVRYNSYACFEQRDSVQCGSRVLVNVGSSGCGNGILDYNEECDCTIDGSTDACCDCGSCRITTGKECSPKTDPYCCHDNCTLKGYSMSETISRYQEALLESRQALGPDESPSTSFINQRLAAKFESMSPCGASDECTLNRYCIADTLFVPYKGQERGSCPSPDWVVSLGTDGSELHQDVCYSFANTSGCSSAVRCESLVPSCFDEYNNDTVATDCYLFHGSDDTTCNNGANMCRYNGCSGSICNQYKREDSVVGVAEKCRLDDTNACDVACIFTGTAANPGPCVSTKEFGVHFPNSSQLHIVTPAEVADGRTCTYDGDRYGGRCLSGVCQDIGVDGADDVGIGSVSRWMSDNWPVVLGLLAGAVLLVILLKVTYKRKKPQLKMLGGKMARTIRKGMGLREFSSSSKPMPATRPPVTSRTHKEMRSKMKKEEAHKRLAVFFPDASKEDIHRILKGARNEEEAVKKMVKAGNPFHVPSSVPLLP